VTEQTTTETLPEPQSGGSYRREADGTLIRVACTAPAQPRDKRARDDEPPAEAGPVT